MNKKTGIGLAIFLSFSMSAQLLMADSGWNQRRHVPPSAQAMVNRVIAQTQILGKVEQEKRGITVVDNNVVLTPNQRAAVARSGGIPQGNSCYNSVGNVVLERGKTRAPRNVVTVIQGNNINFCR